MKDYDFDPVDYVEEQDRQERIRFDLARAGMNEEDVLDDEDGFDLEALRRLGF